MICVNIIKINVKKKYRLCLMSRTCKFFRLDIVSGNDVMTFSESANVVKLVRQPTSGGKVANLFE